MWAAGGLLAVAIGVEVAATALLPRTDGFRNSWALLVVLGYGLAAALLARVVAVMPVSAAYAIWAGAGTALVAAFGVVFLGERLDPVKVISLAAIIGGIVALNLSGGVSHGA